MIIRELTAADRPVVADIYLVDRQRFFPWVAQPELADFERDSNHELVLVAEMDGEIAGFISFYRLENFIHLLFVSPKHQRCGVGHALIEAMRQQATAPMTLKCVTTNENALIFYRREGFEIIREDRFAVPNNYTLKDTHEERYWYR